MAKERKVGTDLPETLDQVAASSFEADDIPDLDEILESLDEPSPTPTRLLKPNQLEPFVDISSIGQIRTGTACTQEFVQAATDHKLPSPRFEAIRAQFSSAFQGILCTPMATYVKAPHTYPVSWSPDGDEMRCDLQALLLGKSWRIPKGYVLRVPAIFYPNHPKAGSVIVLDLKRGEQMDGATRRRKKNLKKKNAGEKNAGEKNASEKNAGEKNAGEENEAS